MSNVSMLIVGCGVIALLYGIIAIKSVLAAPAGNERMQEIAAAIQEGASAYLNRQYTAIAIAGVVIGIVLGGHCLPSSINAFTFSSKGSALISRVVANRSLIASGLSSRKAGGSSNTIALTYCDDWAATAAVIEAPSECPIMMTGSSRYSSIS